MVPCLDLLLLRPDQQLSIDIFHYMLSSYLKLFNDSSEEMKEEEEKDTLCNVL